MTVAPIEVATYVRSILRKVNADAPLVGLQTSGGLPEPCAIDIDGRPWRVVPVRTSFEARRAMARRPDDEGLVLVTHLDPHQLGSEVVAALAGARLVAVEPWEAVREIYGVREIDPRVIRDRMARLLLDAARNGVPPVPSGTLDLETAWVALVGLLGLPAGANRLDDLFDAAAAGSLGDRWRTAPEELRKAFVERLTEVLSRDGAAGLAPVLQCALDRGAGNRLVQLGLIAHALAQPDLHAETRGIVRGRLLADGLSVRGASPEADLEILRLFGQRASRWLRAALARGGFDAVRTLVVDAELMLRRVEAPQVSAASPDLPGGLEARVRQFAAAVSETLRHSAGGSIDAAAVARVEEAWSAIESHALRSVEPRFQGDRPAAEAAVRLLRWLATPLRSRTSLAERADDYRTDGAWVDRARTIVNSAIADPALAAALTTLSAAVAARRESENRLFARTYAEVSAGAVGSSGVLWLEQALRAVVTPVVADAGGRVLVIVMDGMSVAIASELLDSAAAGIALRRVAPGGRWQPVVAPLPTTTETCRTSLLSGELRCGNQTVEENGFRDLAAREGWGSGRSAARLFRKGDLLSSANQLSPEVRDAIQGDAKLVAVVVNAIDDLLHRGEQIRPSWIAETIPILRALLAAAEGVGRAVVLISDHGHVVEWKQTRLAGTPAESGRWRRPGDPPRPRLDEEIEIRGARVVQPTPGCGIVLPWSECLRYGQVQAGYHGGVTPQETVIPLALFAPQAVADALGWLPEAVDPPAWWSGRPERDSPQPIEPTKPLPMQRPPTPKPEELLIDVRPREDAAPLFPRPGWFDALIASETLAAQRTLFGRRPPTDRDLEALILPLVHSGGTLTLEALSRETRMPEGSLRPKLAAVMRLLNVDGYSVLEEAAGTVRLNRELLSAQFGVDAPRTA